MDYLTPKQAKEEFGLDPGSLRRWEEQGQLGEVARTPGNQRRYTRNQLENLIKRNGPPAIAVTTNSRARPDFTEYGVTGLNRFSGSVHEERLRELRGRAGRIKYREMRLNQPVIAAVFFGLVNALKQPSKRVKPASDKDPDKRAAEWLETCFDDMSKSWMDVLDLILNPMFEQGFALTELVYKKRLGPNPQAYVTNPARSKYDDGKVGWRKWAPRPAEALADGSEWIYDAHGGLQGINQSPDVMGGLVKPLVPYKAFDDIEGTESMRGVYSIPIEKLLHFRTTLHPADNPEGLSLLRPMYLAYHYATNLAEIEGIGAERDLAGVPVMYLGEGTTLSGPDSDYEEAKNLVVNLRNDEQTGVVLPHPKMGTAGEGRGVLLELLSTGGRRNWDVGSIVERYEKRMALSCLAQFIMLGMQQVGSYALSRHQGDLFILAASAFLQSIADVINRHGVPRLMALNPFPGITGYPELVFSPVGIPDLAAVSEFVNGLVERQVLTPDPELERHLRQLGGLPAPPAQEVATSQPDPADATDKARSAEETALVIRRLTLAIEPLQKLTVINDQEVQQMLQPLIAELKRSLGVATSQPGQETQPGPDFEANQAQAAQRMDEAIAEGEPVEQAAAEYVALMKALVKKKITKAEENPFLSPTGKKALDRVEGLETDIRREWSRLTQAILNGARPVQALAGFRQQMIELIGRAMSDAWIVARGEPDPEALAQIDEALAIQEDYLNGFIDTLTERLGPADRDTMAGILAGNMARAVLYATSVWLLFNRARVFNRGPDSLWKWDGPYEGSCPFCKEQLDLGVRPLSQISAFPGDSPYCKMACRHELVPG